MRQNLFIKGYKVECESTAVGGLKIELENSIGHDTRYCKLFRKRNQPMLFWESHFKCKSAKMAASCWLHMSGAIFLELNFRCEMQERQHCASTAWLGSVALILFTIMDRGSAF